MSHTEIIFIVITATFASTFGVYVAIKKINQYTRVPINTISRTNQDIELQYIEHVPARDSYLIEPQPSYLPLDLSSYRRGIYDQWTNSFWSETPPSYNTGLIPSYRSGTIPYYHTGNNFYINSCLENEFIINLDLILWLILFIIFTLLVRKFYNFIF
uniref:Uncharacterized protein n=1 Tax=Russula griseocarnosa TaxID=466936 RepID=A0A650AWI0_9AGAM|nr:hypothetical protein [Russula griseocarnosa]